jgi:MFS transporter, SP family, sugar:H+ symporter
MYISETAPAKIRGTLTTIYQLMITLGIFIATVINTILLKTMDVNTSAIWRVALGMQLVPSTLLIILVFFIPYSPRWLAEKGRHDEGQQAIAKLRSLDYSDSAVVTEYDEIRRGVEFEQSIGEASWSEILKPGIRWRVTIAIINQLFQQFTGTYLRDHFDLINLHIL